MSKRVFYGQEATNRILGGAKELSDAVKTTLGPRGRNVIIGRPFGNPIITKDGVTVAKNTQIDASTDDRLGYDIGASLIKEASSKLNDSAGDGTTTVTVVAYKILSEANKLVVAGYSPIFMRAGIMQASEDALEKLKSYSSETLTQDLLEQVGSISASDSAIGSLVAKTIGQIGKDSVVTVEQGQGLGLESEIVEGYTFDRGFVSPYMVTDNSRMEAVYTNPVIVITDKKISNIQEFVPIIEAAVNTGTKDIVIIADDVDGEALATLVLNKMKGALNSVAVKAPSFGDNRKEVLEDIATLTGGKVISSELAHEFKDIDASFFGTAKKVIVSKEKTTIIEGAGDPNNRIDQIDTQLENAKTDYEKENLLKRKGSLTGKVAVIKVGGISETEIEEKKFRVDDAVAAVKAALESGIVPGGGVTLVNIANSLAKKQHLLHLNEETKQGYELFLKALKEPFIALLENSGLSAPVWLDLVEKSKDGQGINVLDANPTLIDLLKEGVVDPTKVTEEVIKSAASIASTAITMGALVVDIPEKEEQPSMNGMM